MLKVRILRTVPVTIIIKVLNLNVQVERLETEVTIQWEPCYWLYSRWTGSTIYGKFWGFLNKFILLFFILDPKLDKDVKFLRKHIGVSLDDDRHCTKTVNHTQWECGLFLMTGWKGISFFPCGITTNVEKCLVILKDFFLRQKNQVIDAAECPGNSSDQHQLSILE